MSATAEKTDTDLKMDVLAEMSFDPSIRVAEIGVLVKEGVVTLNGRAADHAGKVNAVRAAMRVKGVLAVADDIEVDLAEFGFRSDADIASAVAHRITWSTLIPSGVVEISVRGGHVTLEGEVEWGFQKEAAESALQHMAGVKSISNQITVHPAPAVTDTDIGAEIRSALERSALVGGRDIQVEVTGSSVVLKGKVHSHAELEEALRVAWSPQGVHTVDSRLKVDWFWGLVD